MVGETEHHSPQRRSAASRGNKRYCRSALRSERRAMQNLLMVGTLTLLIASGAPARATRVDDFVRGEMKKRHIPGLCVVVVKNGNPVSGPDPTARTRFPGAAGRPSRNPPEGGGS